MRHLDLSYNNFDEDAFRILGALPSLEFLSSMSNGMEGPLSNQELTYNLSNLEVLLLRGNLLNGTLPMEVVLYQFKELPVAFVTFRNRWGATLAAQSQQHSNPLIWITEMAPEPRDVLWRNLSIPYRHLPLYKIGVFVAASLLTLFFAIPVTAVQGIAKYERLKTWFPPAMAVHLMLQASLPFVVCPIFSAIDLIGVYQALKHVHLQTKRHGLNLFRNGSATAWIEFIGFFS